jgi:hypothetical protein
MPIEAVGNDAVLMARADPQSTQWPARPQFFAELMTPVEATQYLRLDEIGHTPKSACRTLTFWRDKGVLKATKYARHVWYLKAELDRFLAAKTEV